MCLGPGVCAWGLVCVPGAWCVCLNVWAWCINGRSDNVRGKGVCDRMWSGLQTPEVETPLPVSPEKRGGRGFSEVLEMVGLHTIAPLPLPLHICRHCHTLHCVAPHPPNTIAPLLLPLCICLPLPHVSLCGWLHIHLTP